ncbi:MAG: carbohydrate ABC transporter substrate-binding protein [Clostridia bacterium]|nr:carbohydrate ABC transporter substrate-binding protein [Clostridia bacterium]
MKRFFCLILVLLMLLPAVISCKKEETSQGNDSDVAATKFAETDDGNLLNTIPDANYGEKEYVITLQAEHEYEFQADEMTGDLANDTLYTWLNLINNRYGVQVKRNVPDGDFFTAQSTETMSGSVNSAIYAHNAFQLYIPVTAKLYKNWNDMGSMIDLTAERWDQKINQESTYNGILYGLSGDLSVSKMMYAMATFYNVALLDEIGYSPEYLYDLVDDGEWTLDLFEQIVKDLYVDNDKNRAKSIGDTFGYLSRSGNSLDMWFAQFNISITSRDTANTISPTLNTEQNVDVIKRLCDFYYNNKGVAYIEGHVQHKTTEAEEFPNGNVAMVTSRFSRATSFAEMGVDAFGILPGPKWNEEQTEYYTGLHDQYAIYGVSKSILDADIDFIAHITDALCAESSQTVYPQYYDVLLKQRYSKDPDTARMVDLVMKNVSFDTAFQFGNFLDSYPYMVRNMVAKNNSNLASEYAAIEKSLPGKLKQVYDLYQ